MLRYKVHDKPQNAEDRQLPMDQLIELYSVNAWSSAEKPAKLAAALAHSDALVTARDDEKMVGVGNANSEGHLVVYYPHLIVHTSYQTLGIGSEIMKLLQGKHQDFHQQMLTADQKAIHYYEKAGFSIAKNTQSMWIYEGDDH